MMVTLAESGHPVFRATCPLFPGMLKSKGGGKLSMPMGMRLKLFFAESFLLISSICTDQSQMCVRNTVLVKQERGDLCWQDNLNY